MVHVFSSQPALGAMVLYRHNHSEAMFFYPTSANKAPYLNKSSKKKTKHKHKLKIAEAKREDQEEQEG